MMCISRYRKKSYITNGDCSLAKPESPLLEPICSGRCAQKGHPIETFTGQIYRCKPDKKVTKEVKLLCASDSRLTTIKVRVVESCKCVLTNPHRRKEKKKKKKNNRRKNKTDKTKNKKRRRKSRRRNRRKNRKNRQSSKLTNNDR